MPTKYSMPIAGAAALSAALSALAGGCTTPSGGSPAPGAPPESRGANGAGEATGRQGGKAAGEGGEEAPARADPAQPEAMMDRTRNHAMATAGFANTMAAFAAPRVIAKAKSLPSREEMLRCIDAYLEVVAETKRAPQGEGNRATLDAEPYALKLRALFAAWTPSTTVPPEIQRNARDVLAALGVPEPPAGWDRFEGHAAPSSP
ncbi:uncharacterized protein SOCE836_025130 [Sorangium cellulosum]|uniref:Secreted protein n=3 Tax=Sorangium TaxID=39643 RepID=A0A4P2QKE1_SORCE|nr:uncharacterized protein SOCE836_025130 [Sorangium cellulosum]WCQ89804.1 hypothetical protein NQZ70_02496 [Sorangium sp. Soce836]